MRAKSATEAFFETKQLRRSTPQRELLKYLNQIIKLRNSYVVPKGQKPTEKQKESGYLSPMPILGNTNVIDLIGFLVSNKKNFITIAIDKKTKELMGYRLAPFHISKLIQKATSRINKIPIKSLQYYLDIAKGITKHALENSFKVPYLTTEACVKKEYQGQGIGRAMVEYEKEFLENQNADVLYVMHADDNERSDKFQHDRGFSKPIASATWSGGTDVIRAMQLNNR